MTSRLVPPVDRFAFRRRVTIWPRGRNRRRAQPLRLQVRERALVEPDPGQRAGVALAPARVGIHHVDELGDVGGAIAGHRGRAQLGRGHHLAVDDQHPVVRAGHERLHDRAGPAGRRPGVGLGRVGGGGHADGDVDAVVAVARLDHERAAEPVQRLRGVGRAPGHDAIGHRDARAAQQLLGQHLVGRDVDPDHRGLLGQRGAHQPAVAAVAEAQHAQLADPADRYPPAAGRGRERGRAHAEAFPLHDPGDPSQLDRQVGVAFKKNVLDRGYGELQQVGGHRGLRGLVLRALGHHVVAAVRPRPHGPAQVHVAAGQAGQLQRHVLGDVAEVGAPGHRLQKPAGAPGRAVVLGQPGQGRGQPAGEARAVGGLPAGQLLELEPRDRDRPGGERVRSAQVTQVVKAHVTLPKGGRRIGRLRLISTGRARARWWPRGSRCRRRIRRAAGAGGRRTG